MTKRTILAKGSSTAQYGGLFLLFKKSAKNLTCIWLSVLFLGGWKKEMLNNEDIHYFLIIKAPGIFPGDEVPLP